MAWIEHYNLLASALLRPPRNQVTYVVQLPSEDRVSRGGFPTVWIGSRLIVSAPKRRRLEARRQAYYSV